MIAIGHLLIFNRPEIGDTFPIEMHQHINNIHKLDENKQFLCVFCTIFQFIKHTKRITQLKNKIIIEIVLDLQQKLICSRLTHTCIK